jgi:hypothetical protein
MTSPRIPTFVSFRREEGNLGVEVRALVLPAHARMAERLSGLLGGVGASEGVRSAIAVGLAVADGHASVDIAIRARSSATPAGQGPAEPN